MGTSGNQIWPIKVLGLSQRFLILTLLGYQNFVSLATKKRLFHQIMPKNRIVPCHSNWVMWPIKIFGLSQGFLIFTLLGYQNEFCVFRNQKNALFTKSTPKNGIVPCHSNWVMWPIKIFDLSQEFLKSTLLGQHNEFCVFRNQKTPFYQITPKTVLFLVI